MTDEAREEDAGSATVVEPTLENDAEIAEGEKPAKLTQTVELKDIGPCKKHIRVSVDRSDLDKRLQEKFKELVVDSNVAGFRPGKAPRKIVEKRYQKEVGDQVKAEVLLQSLEQLADEHDVAPLSAPNIDPFKIELPKEGPLVYEFEVEVRPQFDLPSYKNLKIRRPVHTYSDEEVAEEKRRILAPHGQIVPKESGSVEVGDIITTDITSRDGDRLLNELKELTVRVEPRLAFKDGVAEKFGEQVAGAKAGDKRVVDLTLSTSVSDATLQGKTVKATFDIKDVKTLRLPELTHEFLHEFGVHTEDQLDELVRVVLQRRLEYRQRQSAREQVLSQISAASSWELPHDLLIRQARKSLARRIMEMRSEGISEEEIRGRQRILEQDILQNTALALKEHFVLQKIAEVEKIDVDEDDLNDEIERIADQYQESPRRVRARLEKEDMMEALAAELIERKALDLILDSAEYEDVPLDPKKDAAVGTIEEQGVPGEMQDLTTPPVEEQPAPEQS
jgi:trigger factor